jgi:hypothetical protein
MRCLRMGGMTRLGGVGLSVVVDDRRRDLLSHGNVDTQSVNAQYGLNISLRDDRESTMTDPFAGLALPSSGRTAGLAGIMAAPTTGFSATRLYQYSLSSTGTAKLTSFPVRTFCRLLSDTRHGVLHRFHSRFRVFVAAVVSEGWYERC